MPQITSRAELRRRIDRALVEIRNLVERSPGFAAYEEVERQLVALQRATTNREPSDDERGHVTIGLILVREFDPQPDQALYDVMQNLSEIQAYVRKWPSDGEAPYT